MEPRFFPFLAILVILCLLCVEGDAAAASASGTPSAAKAKPKPTAKPKAKRSSPADPEEEKEGQLQLAEETSKCSACEKLVEAVESRMKSHVHGTTLNPRSDEKKYHRIGSEVRIHDILDDVCSAPELVHNGVSLKGACEIALEEKEELLEAYIRKDKIDSTFKDTLCENRCGLKHSLKSQIQGMKDKMKPSPRQAAEYLVRTNWQWVLGLSAGVFVVTLVLSLWIQLRRLRRKAEKRD
eukprot:RCo036102